MGGFKHIRDTQYKYVNSVEQNGNKFYFARLPQFKCSKRFDNLRDAAKWIDLKLIEKGKKPVNILVAK